MKSAFLPLVAISLSIAAAVFAADATRGDLDTGYTASTGFREAIIDFNERASRDSIGKTQPPLQAKELEAAIYSCVTTVANLPEKTVESVWGIARKRELPKGAYLSFVNAIMEPYDKQPHSNSWAVFLSLGLNEAENSRTRIRIPVRITFNVSAK